jgi:hypothetical protein
VRIRNKNRDSKQLLVSCVVNSHYIVQKLKKIQRRNFNLFLDSSFPLHKIMEYVWREVRDFLWFKSSSLAARYSRAVKRRDWYGTSECACVKWNQWDFLCFNLNLSLSIPKYRQGEGFRHLRQRPDGPGCACAKQWAYFNLFIKLKIS